MAELRARVDQRAKGQRTMMRAWVVLGLLLALVLLLPASAFAAERRYAVVVGVNEGKLGEETLRFAERDAERVAEVLLDYAEVGEEDLVLLRGVGAERVGQVLEQVARRIQADLDRGDQPLLLVYFSGHADADALHLGKTELALDELEQAIRAIPANLRVLVIDACRSGELTRIKGVVPAESFEFRAEGTLDSEGLAIITSSAAGEDAQESDRLGGGIFTHHFVTGLRGAADSSADGRVTLSEAYSYGYVQTLQSTSAARFVQHPTYSFSTSGRDEVVLTRLSERNARLELGVEGTWMVFAKREGGELVAELIADAGTRVQLAEGTYLVRLRRDERVWESSVTLARGEAVALDEDAMTRVHQGQTVRKGYARRVAGSVTLGGELGGYVVNQLGLVGFGSLGFKLDLTPLTLQARVRYGYLRHGSAPGVGDDPAATGIALRQHQAGGDLTLFKLFDLRRFAPGIGLRVGGDQIWQTFATPGEAPIRSQFVGRFGPVIRLEYSPIAAMVLALDLGTDIYVMRSADAAGRVTLPVVPYVGLELGFYVF
ncbi:caspase family protein [Nannocystaceae bacterium ST9]